MSGYEFLLPDVGEGLSQGEIIKWHIALGETVAADQILVDVQTDKAIVEIPSPVAGTLSRHGGAPGEILDVGAILAVIETSGAAAGAGAHAPAPGASAPLVASEPSGVPAAPAPPPTGARPGRARASPAVRKLARSLGVDLTSVTPTGSRNQVTREDVERAVAATPTEAASTAPSAAVPAIPALRIEAPTGADRVEPLRGLRRQIAASMEASWRTIPHIYTMDDVDAGALVAARAAINEDLAADGYKLSFLPFFVKACVAGLKAHPSFNASIDTERMEVVYRHRFNVGIATATPDGLIVTVIHDADRKSLVQIGQEIDALATLARERRIKVEQLSGGTFTISNYGSYGGTFGTPIIRAPEVAIAGFGRIREAVVPVDGQPAVRTRLPLVVSADHRMNDGEHLQGFVGTIAGCLAQPVRLLARG